MELPVSRAKHEIIQAVHRNKTTIFVGDTASGKTTQIPQYLLEAGIARTKCIAVTQPRRVAAVTIAHRVADEMKVELGGKVGYSVRFENVTSSSTKIKFLTEGMLLRESIPDTLLTDYSVVILDEAHERTLCNDVLFGIIRSVQIIRDQEKLMPLKVIIMSATMDYEHLSAYFDNAPVYFIRGREYNIKVLNSMKPQDDYAYSALVTVFQIHQNEDRGDILVFCTGQEEIDAMVQEVKKTAVTLPSDCLSVIAYPLYAALPSSLQAEVFKPTPIGYRKIIFSTNIAETSVTIPGIKYVVDTGMVKAKYYNPACGFDVLKVQRISKAQANQRSGRSGRESDGLCYRLYTLDEYNSFEEHAVPEILRSCLANAILQMIAIGVRNVQKFLFLDRPDDENLKASIRQLQLLDAVIEENGGLKLNECGKSMVVFPLDPRYSKMIITSKAYKCTDEILTIISMLSVESIFFIPSTKKERFADVRRKFECSQGDHIMLLNVYRAYKNNKGNHQASWCSENFINYQNMKRAVAIRKQLSQLCEKVNVPPSSCNGDTVVIRKCLASGLFMNAVQFYKNKTYKTVDGNQKVRIHPSSCLFRSKPSCCIYTELVQTSKIFMRNVSSVDEEWLQEIAPTFFKDKRLSGFKLISLSS